MCDIDITIGQFLSMMLLSEEDESKIWIRIQKRREDALLGVLFYNSIENAKNDEKFHSLCKERMSSYSLSTSPGGLLDDPMIDIEIILKE